MADVPLLKAPMMLAQLEGADTAADGQVPTADGLGGVAWETPAAGPGGGGGSVLPLDDFVSVGSGDLFDGASLDAAWTSLQSTALGIVTMENERLVLGNASATADQDRGIKKSFSPAGDFEVQAKFESLNAYKHNAWAGLFVGAADPANGTGSRLMGRMVFDSGTRRLHYLKHLAGTWSDVFTGTTEWPGTLSDGPIWQRIKRVGTTLSVAHSVDGRRWIDHPVTTTIGFTVATMGIIVGGNYSGNHEVSALVDWVRTV